VLGPEGAGAIVTADETFLAPSDGTVRSKRVTRLGALVLQSGICMCIYVYIMYSYIYMYIYIYNKFL